MELSSLIGGSMPKQEQQPAFEYTAQATSPIVNGEVKLKISEKSFTVTALFGATEIPFAEVNAIALADYVVRVKTDGGYYAFSRMGEWAGRFHDALCDTYNKAVLRSLFVNGKPLVTAKGDYRYTENGASECGAAPVYVFDNSVVVLPPDLGARRVPLCFVSGMDKGDYAVTLRLDTGESYTFSKLGYDTAPTITAVEKQLRALREKAFSAVRELDPALTAAQASQLAGLMPEGAAAEQGQLASIAPAFTAALEAKIAQTCASEYFKALAEVCSPSQIWIGFRKNENLFWLIAPSPNGQHAIVEFLEPDSATFVYKIHGNFEAFAKQLNRALEAIYFKREVIRLTFDELRKPENADYYMASKRTAALRFVRANFTGRVIHSNPEAWKRKLTEM